MLGQRRLCVHWLLAWGCVLTLSRAARALAASSGLPLTHHAPLLQKTTWECPENERPINRVCIFNNLAIYEGNLTIFYRGARPEPPDIVVRVDGHHQFHASFHLQDLEASSPHPVAQVAEAVFEQLTHTQNFYHGLGEALPMFHIKACTYLRSCNATSKLHLYHISPWMQEEERSVDWLKAAPYMEPFVNCLAANRVLHYAHPSLAQQTTVLERAVIGIGPTNRHHNDGWKPGFHQNFRHPDARIMALFRQRMLDCANVATHHRQRPGKLGVTIMQRSDGTRRHFLNAAETRSKILQAFPDEVGAVRIVRPAEMTMAEQLAAMQETDVVILTFGAQVANLMFLPPGAAVVQYTWQADQFSWEFEFANELLEDMGLPALLLAVAGKNESLMTWNMQDFLHQPGWHKLTDKQRLSFFQGRKVPIHELTDLSRYYHGDFYLDWQCLQPALELSIREQTQKGGITSYSFRGLDGAHARCS